MGVLRARLLELYRCLFEQYGPQHWWPGESRFEVMAGAILTQSASWANAAAAISSLKRAGALSAEAIREMPLDELARLVRPSGYYNAKAKKLKAMAEWLGGHGDDLDRAFDGDTAALRGELLSVHGIGPETADSILLYAAGRPVFVVDAYARRILGRVGIISGGESYDRLQRLLHDNLGADAALFNEYHALLVAAGKTACRRQPKCGECCIAGRCLRVMPG